MAHQMSPLEAIIAGAIGGFAGSEVIARANKWAMAKLPKPQPIVQTRMEFREGDGYTTVAEPPEKKNDPKLKLAAKIKGGLFEEELEDAEKTIWSQAIHYSFGMTWGVIYGILAGTFAFPALIAGPIFGAFVWAFGRYIALPRFKLEEPPENPTEPKHLVMIGTHVLYGTTVALVFWLFDRARRPFSV